MFEQFGFETLTAPQAAVWFALGLGVLFGILAAVTRFCLRRALVGEDRREAAGVWLAALVTALLGTQAAVAFGVIDMSGHRFFAADLPWLSILVGGLAFGGGMVLSRGCISRLTVLGAGGNLRSLSVLVVVALVAHAMLKGVLAPLRLWIGSVTLPLGDITSLADLPGGTGAWTAALAMAALAVVATSRARPLHLLLAVLIGALVPLAWVGTGWVLYDDFDPIAMQGLSFTAPTADMLFWTIASSAIAPNFGVGLVGGTLAGAFLAALVTGRFAWQSFGSPRETGRYLAGAALMGAGGVLAGGCTVGAGLSGVPTLSLSALLALAAIAAGALATDRLLNRAPAPAVRQDAGSGESRPTRALQPAE